MSPLYTPKNSFQLLKEGNSRFTQGLRSIHSFAGPDRLSELAEKGQKPFATILTCSDSRLPAELLFDRGFGDLFVVRVAGNVVAPSLIASMEFASLQFGTPLILVMGHTNCGAVKAAREYVNNPKIELTDNLRELVSRITPSIRSTDSTLSQSNPDQHLDACTWNNVKHSMSTILEQSVTLRNLVKEGRVEIRGAVYDLKTGRVVFEDDKAQNHSSESIHQARMA